MTFERSGLKERSAMTKRRILEQGLIILAALALGSLLPAQDARPAVRFSSEKDLDARDAKRVAVFKEDRVLDLAGIRPGMRVAELGAGDGYLTLMLASRVGGEGMVYANDIRASVLDVLAERAGRRGLGNIRTVLGTDDDPRLPEGGLDAAFMVFCFHEFKNPGPMLARLADKMKETARLFIVEFPQAPGAGRAKGREVYEAVFKDSPFALDEVDEKTLDIPEGRAVIYVLSLRGRRR
jgi:SAM-dependent methyltransferase